MDVDECSGAGAQSVDRALGLLSLVSRHGVTGVSIASVVKETGLSRPTVRRLLLALIRAHLVTQDPVSRNYFLGEEAFVIGVLASRRYGIQDVAHQSLIALSEATGDTSFLCVRRGAHSVCVYREEGTYPIRTHALLVGTQHPLGVGAGSLAMLAALGDEEVEAMLDANAAIFASRFPKCERECLLHEVTATRQRGWALNPGLVVQNSWAVGVSVNYPDGRLAGALSVAAIDSRMGEARQQEVAALLTVEATSVEQRLARMFDGVRSSEGRSAEDHLSA